jgi:sugar lactone lactonase YvrE
MHTTTPETGMRRSNAVVMIAAGAALIACGKQETAATDTTKAPAAAAPATATATASKLGETPNMKTPESVRYDPELDVFYVSNINGNPSQHDGNGFIAVVRADSTSVVKMLVEGGKNGATLDAPKGLALVGDTLWVADINHVRAFNRRTGAKIADIDLSSQHASFLNDAGVGGDGAVYFTDSGLLFDAKGAMTHPGTDQIFKIEGRKVTVIKADSLNAPNGITWDAANARFLLAPFSGNAVQTWKPGDKATTTLVTGPGAYDGIEALADGRILVTSWTDSSVHVVKNGAMTTLIPNVTAPADIGVDTKRQVVAIPRFNDGKVDYYKIP